MKVIVKVKRPPDQQAMVTVLRNDTPLATLPHAHSVIPNLDSQYRKTANRMSRSYPGILACITHTPSIPTQAWSDAIGKYLISTLASSIEADTQLETVADGGYMSLGNTLYRMSAVGMVQHNRALSPLRRRILDDARADATKIVSDANADAIEIRRRIVDERLKWQAEREAANRAFTPPPDWCCSYYLPLHTRDGRIWYVGMIIPFSPTHLDYQWTTADGNKSRTFELKPPAERPVPLNVLIWVPLNLGEVWGNYTPNAIKLDTECPSLPHVHHNGGCLSPGQRPPKLNSYDAYRQLRSGITRTFQRIQLNSLLVPHSDWSPEVWSFFPAELAAALKAGRSLRDWCPKSGPPIETVNFVEERRETWSAT